MTKIYFLNVMIKNIFSQQCDSILCAFNTCMLHLNYIYFFYNILRKCLIILSHFLEMFNRFINKIYTFLIGVLNQKPMHKNAYLMNI